MGRPLYGIDRTLQAPRPGATSRPAALHLSRSEVLPIALFTLVAAVLRLVMLGSPALWTDEAFQAVVAAKPIPQLLAIVSHDSAPPLSYLLVHLAGAVFPSTAGVRLVSAIAGVALVPVGAALAWRLGGTRAAVAAAALLALVPADVVMARDARMYSLAALLVLASALALLRCADRPSAGRFVVWSLCAAAGVYTHYFVALAIACQVLGVLALLRHDAAFVARTALAGIGSVLAVLPWLLYALPQLAHVSTPFWVPPLTSGRLQELPINLMNGISAMPTGVLGMAIHDLRIASVCALFAGLAALAWSRRWSRPAAALTVAGLAPLLVLGLVSLAKPVFEPRYLEPLWQPLLPVAALGLAQIPWRPAVAILLLPLAVTAPLVALSLPNADVPALLARIPARLPEGAQVITSGSQYYFPVYYYGGPDVRRRLRIAGWPVRWYDGAAAIPPGSYIGQITSTGGALYLFGDRNYWARVPAGYAVRDARCVGDICLRIYLPVTAG